MKRLLIIGLAVVIYGCTSSHKPPYISENMAKPEQEEEHEVIILDSGFENWFATKWSPANERSLSYYDSWNDRYVQAWNYKATQPGSNSFFQNVIQYDYGKNYGIEVERKLYYYFRYVETELGIPILDSNRPKSVF